MKALIAAARPGPPDRATTNPARLVFDFHELDLDAAKATHVPRIVSRSSAISR
jgi:hypothetical protein